MGLFSRTPKPPPVTVTFESNRAMNVGNVRNLSANLDLLARQLDWPNRSERSPVVQTTLTPATDTYGHDSIAVLYGKMPVGFLLASSMDEMLPAVQAYPNMPAAYLMEDHHGVLIAFCCPAVRGAA